MRCDRDERRGEEEEGGMRAEIRVISVACVDVAEEASAVLCCAGSVDSLYHKQPESRCVTQRAGWLRPWH